MGCPTLVAFTRNISLKRLFYRSDEKSLQMVGLHAKLKLVEVMRKFRNGRCGTSLPELPLDLVKERISTCFQNFPRQTRCHAIALRPP
jgi:hypothetical protein